MFPFRCSLFRSKFDYSCLMTRSFIVLFTFNSFSIFYSHPIDSFRHFLCYSSILTRFAFVIRASCFLTFRSFDTLVCWFILSSFNPALRLRRIVSLVWIPARYYIIGSQ